MIKFLAAFLFGELQYQWQEEQNPKIQKILWELKDQAGRYLD